MTSKMYQEILSDHKLHHIVSIEGRVYVDGVYMPDLDSVPEQATEYEYDWFKEREGDK